MIPKKSRIHQAIVLLLFLPLALLLTSAWVLLSYGLAGILALKVGFALPHHLAVDAQDHIVDLQPGLFSTTSRHHLVDVGTRPIVVSPGTCWMREFLRSASMTW